MGVDIAARRVEVELSQLRVVGTRTGDQQVVDGCWQRVEEPPEPAEVRGIEGGDAGPELEAGTVQAVRVAGGKDDVRSLGASEPGRLQPDAGAAPDEQDGLPEQVLLGRRGEELIEAAMVPPDVGSPVRVTLAASGVTLSLRLLRRPRETPWRNPWSAGFLRPSHRYTLG